MFQIKNFVSIVAGALNYVRGVTTRITDLQPGSVTRTLIEAPAQEVEELYVQMFNGLLEAIPVATYKSFNFQLLTATYAGGMVSVTTSTPLTQPIDISKNTIFTAKDGRQYRTLGDMTWPVSETTINIPVSSVKPGFSGNAAIGEIVASTTFPPPQFSISNAAITGGKDSETENERMARFASFIASLSRGTKDSLLYSMTTVRLLDTNGNATEWVTRIGYDYTLGFNHLYIWSNLGIPSNALLTQAQTIINGYTDPATGTKVPGYSAAGVRTDVAAMASHKVPMSFFVEVAAGYTLDAAMKQQIRNAYYSLLASVGAGETIRPDDVRAAALQVPGVTKASVSMSSNITCGQSEVLTATDADVLVSAL